MDWRFLANRYLYNRRIVNGYKYQFHPYWGGEDNEPFLRDIILKSDDFHKKRLFVDVGANIGGWAIPASDHYLEVMAFEANPATAMILAKNVRMNKKNNVRVYPVALGLTEQEKDFFMYPYSSHDSFYPEHQGLKSDGRTIRVPIRSLDSYRIEPETIKIDTEGYELEVLGGAHQTIKSARPSLVVETHRTGDSEKIIAMFPDYEWIKKDRGIQTILVGRQ